MMWLRFGVVILALAIGFVFGWLAIKRERRHSACDNALLRWKEAPVSVWHQDRTIALFIALHASSVIALAILFLLDATWRGTQPTLFLIDATPFMPPRVLAEFQQELTWIVTGGLGIVWLFCGSFLAYPLARQFVRPLQYAIMTEGIVSGPHLYPWGQFSYFTSHPHPNRIRLHSAQTPEMVSMLWQPPDAAIFHQAVALLTEHLPSSSPQPTVPWRQRASVRLGMLLIATTIPFVAAGLWIYALGLGWAWLYYTFVPTLIVILGAFIFRQL